ncbi:MAG: hypothetical protein O7C75_11165 [Verrucomicrobia bacterium]|nr:hypothetical protein [Verrucomicrobiota bacterium]
MSSSDQKKANFGNPIINLLITGLVYLFFTWILRPHVPAQTVLYQWIFSGFASMALTATFYLSINMFRVTLNDHKERKNQ